MNTVIAFDLGKVLVNFDYGIAASRIAAQSNLSSDKIQPLIEQSRLIIDYESGRLTRVEFFEAICKTTGFGGVIEEFGEFFANIFTPIQLMTDLQAELRRRGFKTYIFSNTNDLAIEHLCRNFPFIQNFDGYIFSYEVGAMKPDVKIYEALEKLCGRSGADLVYIDDRPENIEAGNMRGWKTILYESPVKSRAILQELLQF